MHGTNPQYTPLLSGSDTISYFEAKSKCNLRCMKVVIDALDENGAESTRRLVLKLQPQAGLMEMQHRARGQFEQWHKAGKGDLTVCKH